MNAHSALGRRIWGVGDHVHDAIRQLRIDGEVETVTGVVEHDDHSVEFEFTEDGHRYRVIVEHIGEER
jgi:hypothetical protein